MWTRPVRTTPMPKSVPRRMSRPTRGSRTLPASSRDQATSVAGQNFRTYGSSARYSSQRSPALNSAEPIPMKNRFISTFAAAKCVLPAVHTTMAVANITVEIRRAPRRSPRPFRTLWRATSVATASTRHQHDGHRRLPPHLRARRRRLAHPRGLCPRVDQLKEDRATSVRGGFNSKPLFGPAGQRTLPCRALAGVSARRPLRRDRLEVSHIQARLVEERVPICPWCVGRQ